MERLVPQLLAPRLAFTGRVRRILHCLEGDTPAIYGFPGQAGLKQRRTADKFLLWRRCSF